MVEKDPVAGVQPIGRPVVHEHVVGVGLGSRVRTARVEPGPLVVRRLGCVAEQLAAGECEVVVESGDSTAGFVRTLQ